MDFTVAVGSAECSVAPHGGSSCHSGQRAIILTRCPMAGVTFRPPADLRATLSPTDLRATLSQRVVIADGAMGTMLQRYDLTLEDFQQLEGCNEILNVTRPDIVRAIHDAYFEVGVDAVETNTFGTNLSALGEYGIADRITELAEAAARIARESADAYSTPERPRWVLGSVGPGTKLPTLGPRLLRPAAGRLPAAGRRPDRRRRRRGADRDLTRSAANEGRDAGCQTCAGVRGPRSSGDRARDRRDHGHHAARLGDRCRAHRRSSRSAST